MRRSLIGALVVLLATSGMPAKADGLTLAQAMRVIEAAKAEAERIHRSAVIAVVDSGGWLIALQRMDDPAMLASVELAPGKAKTAALFRKPTAALEKSIDGGRFAAVTAPGAVEMQGGIPLEIGGRIVGAVGVSTDTPEHDQQIAEAGVKALAP